MFWSFRTWNRIEAFYQFRTAELKYSFSIMAKRQLNSTEVITESSSEASRLQRVLSFSVLLFCIKDKSIVLMSHEKFSCYHLYSLAENQTVPNVRSSKKPHFPPKAAPASCQDLITASYKPLIWWSKSSKIPFLSSLQLPQCTARNWHSSSRGLHSSHTWSQAGKRRMGRTNRLCLSSCIPASHNGHSSP